MHTVFTMILAFFRADNRCFLNDLILAFPSADTAAFAVFADFFNDSGILECRHRSCFDDSGILECRDCYFGHDARCFEHDSGTLVCRYCCFTISSAYRHSLIRYSSDRLEYI